MTQLYSILLPLKFSVPFTYRCSYEAKLLKGQLVKIPFRNHQMVGMVTGAAQDYPGEVKEIIAVYPNLVLKENLVHFIEKVANYNLASLGLVFKMLLGGNKNFDHVNIGNKTSNDFGICSNTIELRPEQKEALKIIDNKLNQSKYSSILLEGVTGSGKTEVYLKAVERVINSGKQALVLLPEIVLTTQLIKRFEERLGFKPVEWHSATSMKDKKINWQKIVNDESKFIVGARSALFLPYPNLGLIIVDEEHDQSYKQEEGVIYNARDMAILKASIENIPIILSSATPSVETIHNVLLNKFCKVHLPSRYGDATLPEIDIVDLNKEQMKSGEWLSPTLKSHLNHLIETKQQSLLFLNRRGYAPITYCANCRHKAECPDCNFWMVEHKKKGILQCHYCGFTIPKVTKCSKCGSTEKVLALGPGVERIEEEIKHYLPNARTLLFTSDTIENSKKAKQAIDAIINHEIDIVIGTQMIAKGLHFPKLNLVGVIEADKNLIGGDIRTLERTYQLLHQVSGRAGRSSQKGKVIIQTYTPESALLKYLSSQNNQSFYEAELNDRREAEMPPFTRLGIITLKSLNESACLEVADHIAAHIPQSDDITIFGPSPAPIFVLRRNFRYRFIIKVSKNLSLAKVIHKWLSPINIPHKVKLKIDIDPYSFL